MKPVLQERVFVPMWVCRVCSDYAAETCNAGFKIQPTLDAFKLAGFL